MKEEINSIMATNAVDKQKKKELSEATTTFFLHKNYINMRALYGKNDGLRQLPKVLNEAPDMNFEVGKSPINKVNFTANYDKLKENTIFKKEIDQTETLLPDIGSQK